MNTDYFFVSKLFSIKKESNLKTKTVGFSRTHRFSDWDHRATPTPAPFLHQARYH